MSSPSDPSYIFADDFVEITINSYTYYVSSTAYKKYLCHHDTELTHFELVIDGVPAPEIVSDNLILELHTKFKSKTINGDMDNYQYYLKFFVMYLDYENIDHGIKRIYMIRRTLDYLLYRSQEALQNMDSMMYDFIGRSFITMMKKSKAINETSIRKIGYHSYNGREKASEYHGDGEYRFSMSRSDGMYRLVEHYIFGPGINPCEGFMENEKIMDDEILIMNYAPEDYKTVPDYL